MYRICSRRLARSGFLLDMTRHPAGKWKGKQASVIYACERKKVNAAMTDRKVQGIVELHPIAFILAHAV